MLYEANMEIKSKNSLFNRKLYVIAAEFALRIRLRHTIKEPMSTQWFAMDCSTAI